MPPGYHEGTTFLSEGWKVCERKEKKWPRKFNNDNARDVSTMSVGWVTETEREKKIRGRENGRAK